MSSAGRQLARLYLRGTWLHKAMTNMDREGAAEIDKIITMVMEDPNLQGAKTEFCASLGRTIGFEYKDPDVALEDYRIAIMRAAIAARCGWGTKSPKPAVLTDPIQRKKFFQTWAFQYLRQILYENKIPGYQQRKNVKLPAEQAALCNIETIFNNAYKDEKNDNLKRVLKSLIAHMHIEEIDFRHFEIFIDHFSFPIEVMFEVQDLAEKYLSHNVRIMQEVDRIIVKADDDEKDTSIIDVCIYEDVRISLASFDNDDEEGNLSDCLQFEAQKHMIKPEPTMNKDLEELRKKLPEDCLPVFDILSDAPLNYIERFGSSGRSFNKMNLSRFLGITPKEVERILNVIRHYAISEGIGLE